MCGQGDLAKFAKASATADDCKQALTLVRQMVAQTRAPDAACPERRRTRRAEGRQVAAGAVRVPPPLGAGAPRARARRCSARRSASAAPGPMMPSPTRAAAPCSPTDRGLLSRLLAGCPPCSMRSRSPSPPWLWPSRAFAPRRAGGCQRAGHRHRASRSTSRPRCWRPTSSPRIASPSPRR